MKIRDSVDRHFEHARLSLSACDVDSDGMIENIDIVVDGKLKFCINLQGENTPMERYREALGLIFAELTGG